MNNKTAGATELRNQKAESSYRFDDFSQILEAPEYFSVVSYHAKRFAICGEKSGQRLSDYDDESVDVCFCAFPLSKLLTQDNRRFSAKLWLNCPSAKMVCASKLKKTETLLQIRARGKTHASYEVATFDLKKIDALQPSAGRVVYSDEALLDTFVISAEDLFSDRRMLESLMSTKIVVCRAAHSVQFKVFWLAVANNVIPVLPEGPEIVSYGVQPVIDALLKSEDSRLTADADHDRNSIGSFLKRFSQFVAQVRFQYGDGLDLEIAQLDLDFPASSAMLGIQK